MQGEKQRTKQKRARQLASDPRADRGGAAAPPADVAADSNAAGSASNIDSAPSADLPNRGSKRPARRKNTPSYQLDEVWEEESEEEEEEEEESDEGATLSCPRGRVGLCLSSLASMRNGGRTATEIANDSISCFGPTTVRMSGRWRMAAVGMTSTCPVTTRQR